MCDCEDKFDPRPIPGQGVLDLDIKTRYLRARSYGSVITFEMVRNAPVEKLEHLDRIPCRVFPEGNFSEECYLDQTGKSPRVVLSGTLYLDGSYPKIIVQIPGYDTESPRFHLNERYALDFTAAHKVDGVPEIVLHLHEN